MSKIAKIVMVSAVAGAMMAGLPALQRLVILPVYLQADNQWAMSLLNRVCSILLLPGKRIMYQVSPPQAHYFETVPLLLATGLNFIFYFCIMFALLSVWFRRDLRKELVGRHTVEMENSTAADQILDAPQSPQRRQFISRSAISIVGVAAVGMAGYPVLVRPGWLTVRRVNVPISNLPPTLSGFTIAQLTDLHHDEWISIEHVRSAVNLANDLHADLIALTGDYVTAQTKFIRPAVEELSRLKARTGSVGVMGNHDWWADPGETRKQFKAFEIPLIDNGRLFVTTDRQLVTDTVSEGICIGGVGDLWEDKVAPERALAGVPGAMPRVLLSHNPDVVEHGAIGAGDVRVDLVISGHTHGGQVRLPVVGTPVVPSRYGQRYVHGLVQGPHCQVQISAGIGMAVLPVRLGVPPEIVLITLVPATA